MNDAPLVSVVTPSLDQGRFLEEAIRSVLDQDYPAVEHIVVDGGSDDETVSILRRHPQLRWMSERDAGQAAAIDKGFALARGSIYTWLNADDYLLPGAISAAVEVLSATGCALVHGGWRRIEEDGTVIGDVPVVPFDLERQRNRANAVCQPGAFFTRDAYRAVGGVDPSYRYAMDYELWLKLGERFEVREIDRIQAAYRYHPVSKSVAEYDAFGPETLRASREHGGRRFSPMYVDHYLPKQRPWAYRLLLLARLLASGDTRGIARRLRR